MLEPGDERQARGARHTSRRARRPSTPPSRRRAARATTRGRARRSPEVDGLHDALDRPDLRRRAPVPGATTSRRRTRTARGSRPAARRAAGPATGCRISSPIVDASSSPMKAKHITVRLDDSSHARGRGERHGLRPPGRRTRSRPPTPMTPASSRGRDRADVGQPLPHAQADDVGRRRQHEPAERDGRDEPLLVDEARRCRRRPRTPAGPRDTRAASGSRAGC